MKYSERDFVGFKSKIYKYSQTSISFNRSLQQWKIACEELYGDKRGSFLEYLKIADARKLLASQLQDKLLYMEEKDRNSVCGLICEIVEYGNKTDVENRSNQQEQAWKINQFLKKFDYLYWELILREMGEDESDVVRKVYEYIQKTENRFDVADTLYEYLEKFSLEDLERIEIEDLILQMENQTIYDEVIT